MIQEKSRSYPNPDRFDAGYQKASNRDMRGRSKIPFRTKRNRPGPEPDERSWAGEEGKGTDELTPKTKDRRKWREGIIIVYDTQQVNGIQGNGGKTRRPVWGKKGHAY